tara:strand:- start:826 stop:1482 length:657 start_codon:yes stop_codon:yes gene_type:complete
MLALVSSLSLSLPSQQWVKSQASNIDPATAAAVQPAWGGNPAPAAAVQPAPWGGNTAVANEASAAPCKEVCGGLAEAWGEKCTWSFKCSGCSECVLLSPGSAEIRKAARTGVSHLKEASGANEDAAPCLSICEDHQDSWSSKCKWPTKCSGCEKCVGYMYAAKDSARLAAKAAAPCKPACHSPQNEAFSWGTKCKWPTMCSGCSSCALEGWWSKKPAA